MALKSKCRYVFSETEYIRSLYCLVFCYADKSLKEEFQTKLLRIVSFNVSTRLNGSTVLVITNTYRLHKYSMEVQSCLLK